jgi:hypothetical protein
MENKNHVPSHQPDIIRYYNPLFRHYIAIILPLYRHKITFLPQDAAVSTPWPSPAAAGRVSPRLVATQPATTPRRFTGESQARFGQTQVAMTRQASTAKVAQDGGFNH